MSNEYSDETARAIQDQVKELFIKFSTSSEYDCLTKAEKDDAQDIISTYADFMYGYELRDVEHWTQGATSYILADIFPEKIAIDSSYFEAVSPVLKGFFKMLGRTKMISNADALIKGVNLATKAMLLAAKDPNSWSPGKQFAMQAQDAGVDMSDQESLDRFTSAYNLASGATKKWNEIHQKSGNQLSKKQAHKILKRKKHDNLIPFPKNSN